ncbi:unnamed protein product [Closterium sp. NIES-54]
MGEGVRGKSIRQPRKSSGPNPRCAPSVRHTLAPLRASSPRPPASASASAATSAGASACDGALRTPVAVVLSPRSKHIL